MKIALLGNGLSFDCKLDLVKYNLIVAVDGAANACADFDIEPNLIIGDMDSIIVDPAQLWPNCDVITIADQSMTDIDKALAHISTIQPNHDSTAEQINNRTNKQPNEQTIIDGFWLTSSDRIDHTLYNLMHLFSHPFTQPFTHQGLRWIYTPHERIGAVPDTILLNDPAGTRISLISLSLPLHTKLSNPELDSTLGPALDSTLIVDITGCTWSGTSLTIDYARAGVSNTITKSPARITKISGQGILCVSI